MVGQHDKIGPVQLCAAEDSVSTRPGASALDGDASGVPASLASERVRARLQPFEAGVVGEEVAPR